MAKIKIAQNPTFKTKVSIPRVGGTFQEVEFEFTYRGRKALAEMYAGWEASAVEQQKQLKEKGAEVTMVDFTRVQIELEAEQVRDLVVGWGFNDALNDESILALVETSAGASEAIVRAYQEAFVVARLGN